MLQKVIEALISSVAAEYLLTSLFDSPLFHQVRLVADEQCCSDTRHTGKQSLSLL